ncbi:MAG: conjugal transfer protein TrbF [Sphingorhabdus sp.]
MIFNRPVFTRSLQRYGVTPEPVTPYQRAGQIWDERIGSARLQARNWRLMAFGTFVLACGLSGALVWQSGQSRVVPYVVAVDELGEARALAPADQVYQPTDPQLSWHLARFVAQVRGLSLDPVIVRENWLSAYDYTTDNGARFLSEHARESAPFSQVGEKSISVQVTSVVRASEKSFQVKWIESQYSRGNLGGRAHWTAIITIIVKPPHKLEVLRKNPLGIYVDAIAWSRELGAVTGPDNLQAPGPLAQIQAGVSTEPTRRFIPSDERTNP